MKKDRKARRPPLVRLSPEWAALVSKEHFRFVTDEVSEHRRPELLAKIHELLLRLPLLEATYDDVAAPARLLASLRELEPQVLALQEIARSTSTGYLMEKVSRAIRFEMNGLAGSLRPGRPAPKNQGVRLVACFMQLLFAEFIPNATKRQWYLLVFRVFDLVGVDHPAGTRCVKDLDPFFLSSSSPVPEDFEAWLAMSSLL